MTILFIWHKDKEIQNRDIIEIIIFCDFLFLLSNLFFCVEIMLKNFFIFENKDWKKAKKMRKCLHKRYMKSAVLIALGVIFLLDMFWVLKSNLAFGFLYKLWPLFLIIPGVMMLFSDEEEAVEKKWKKTESREDLN